jgi:predicted enzyme related to lactoylglutathione lyase
MTTAARMFKTAAAATGEDGAMAALANLTTVIIDSADPGKLGEFYRTMTGWDTTYSDDDFVYLGNDGPVQLGFQRVDGYRSAGWPDPAKHFHLDFKVSDVDTAVTQLLAAGATRPDFQPGEGKWVVLADPEGHAFCVMS